MVLSKLAVSCAIRGRSAPKTQCLQLLPATVICIIQLQFFKAVNGKELTQWSNYLPRTTTNVKKHIPQIMEFPYSSREITLPCERQEFDIPKTLREACWHGCFRKVLILQPLQLPHMSDILNKGSAFLVAFGDV